MPRKNTLFYRGIFSKFSSGAKDSNPITRFEIRILNLPRRGVECRLISSPIDYDGDVIPTDEEFRQLPPVSIQELVDDELDCIQVAAETSPHDSRGMGLIITPLGFEAGNINVSIEKLDEQHFRGFDQYSVRIGDVAFGSVLLAKDGIQASFTRDTRDDLQDGNVASSIASESAVFKRMDVAIDGFGNDSIVLSRRSNIQQSGGGNDSKRMFVCHERQ